MYVMRNKKKVHNEKAVFGCSQIAKEKLKNVSEMYIIWNFRLIYVKGMTLSMKVGVEFACKNQRN